MQKAVQSANFMESKKIIYISFFSRGIEALGYDPQCAILEVRLYRGQIRRYEGVPEDVWYHLRENKNPDVYYRRYICGCFPEIRILEE